MFNFPDIPAVGEIYSPENGPSWKWNGSGWESLVVATPPFPVVAGVKLILQATTSFYFAPLSGNDATGDGSLVNPFKTVSGTIAFIERHIDTNHQEILINWKTVDGVPDAGILRDSLIIPKRLLNQDGSPSTLYIRGHINPTSTDELKAYVWSPPVNTSAITLSDHAAAHIKGFWFDHTESFNEGATVSEEDTSIKRQADGIAACRATINCNNGSLLYVENCGFGFCPINYINAQVNSFISWFGDFWCEANNITLTTTIIELGVNKIYYIEINEGEFPLHIGMGVFGQNISTIAYVTDIGEDGDGKFIIISEYPTETTTNEILTLSTYSLSAFKVTQNSVIKHNSDNMSGGAITWIRKSPHYMYGFIQVDASSYAEWGSTFMDPANMITRRGMALKGALEISVDSATGIEQGFMVHAPQVAMGSTIISIVGDDLGGIATLDKPTIADITDSDILFGFLPIIIGYKFTANLNSSVRPTGPNNLDIMPGAMPYYGNTGDGRGAIDNDSIVESLSIDKYGGVRFAGYVPNIRYDGGYTRIDDIGTQALNTNAIYYTPFRIRETRLFTGIGFNITETDTATQLRLGIYTANLSAAGHPPYNLIFDAGLKSVDTAGSKTIIISKELAAGEYWIGIQLDGLATVSANSTIDGVHKFGSTQDPGVAADLLFSQIYLFSNGLPLVGTIETREAGNFPNIFIQTGV